MKKNQKIDKVREDLYLMLENLSTVLPENYKGKNLIVVFCDKDAEELERFSLKDIDYTIYRYEEEQDGSIGIRIKMSYDFDIMDTKLTEAHKIRYMIIYSGNEDDDDTIIYQFFKYSHGLVTYMADIGAEASIKAVRGVIDDTIIDRLLELTDICY